MNKEDVAKALFDNKIMDTALSYIKEKYYPSISVEEIKNNIQNPLEKSVKTENFIDNEIVSKNPKDEYLKYIETPQYLDISKKFYGQNSYEKMLSSQKDLVNSAIIDNTINESGATGTAEKEKYVNKDGTNVVPSFELNDDFTGKFVYPKDSQKVPSKIGFNFDSFKVSNNEQLSTTIHEYSHVTDQGMPFSTSKESNLGNESSDFLTDKWGKFLKENVYKENNDFEDFSYLSRPTEVRARINAARMMLIKDNPSIDFNQITDEELDSKLSNQVGYREVLKVLPKEKALFLMKNFASNSNINQNNRFTA
jgi:hypothetical protein